jgi:hypothetical protein
MMKDKKMGQGDERENGERNELPNYGISFKVK